MGHGKQDKEMGIGPDPRTGEGLPVQFVDTDQFPVPCPAFHVPSTWAKTGARDETITVKIAIRFPMLEKMIAGCASLVRFGFINSVV